MKKLGFSPCVKGSFLSHKLLFTSALPKVLHLLVLSHGLNKKSMLKVQIYIIAHSELEWVYFNSLWEAYSKTTTTKQKTHTGDFQKPYY